MQITGLLLKAKIGRYLMRNGGGLDANIQTTAVNPSLDSFFTNSPLYFVNDMTILVF